MDSVPICVAVSALACVVDRFCNSVVDSVPIWAAESLATSVAVSVEICVAVRLPNAVVVRPLTWAVDSLETLSASRVVAVMPLSWVVVRP